MVTNSNQTVSEYLSIGETAAYELFHAEGFPVFRIGRSQRVRKVRLDEYLDRIAGIKNGGDEDAKN